MSIFRPSPSDYVREYHAMPVAAIGPTGTIISETVRVTGYQIIADAERQKLRWALQKVLKLKVLPTTGSFRFPEGDVMGSHEEFYWQSLRRAFHFKASPAEMRDALRLAYRCGRIGTGKDVAGQPAAALTLSQYARQNFGQDCNALVGNYFNLSPELHISCFAYSSQKQEDKIVELTAKKPGWNGWGRAEVLSLPYVPLARRDSAGEARDGDVLVDVQDGTKWAHVALVQDVAVVDKDTVSWRVVEWGESTAESSIDTSNDRHVKQIKTVKLTKGPKKDLGVGHTSMNGKRFRYLFAGPDTPWTSATFGRCGVDDA